MRINHNQTKSADEEKERRKESPSEEIKSCKTRGIVQRSRSSIGIMTNMFLISQTLALTSYDDSLQFLPLDLKFSE